MVMSATPFWLTATESYWRSDGWGCRRAAGPPPRLEADPTDEAEDQERDDRVEDPDPRVALAAPGEQDLDDEEEHQGAAHAPAPAAEASAERPEQQHERADEDQIAEAVMEVEALRELVLAEGTGIGLVGCVEGAVAGRADLHEHGERKEQGPVAMNRPQRPHDASLDQ